VNDGDREALARIESAFGECPRPEHFTEWQHCCECAEHDAELAAHTPETIGLAELGNAGWDPICFATPEAYLYYLPGLARLALGRAPDYYLEQFLFHLNADRSAILTPTQREAVRRFLEHIMASRTDDPDVAFDLAELGRVIDRLSGSP